MNREELEKQGWKFPKSEEQLKQERITEIQRRISVYSDDLLMEEWTYYEMDGKPNADHITYAGWTIGEWYAEIKKELDKRKL